MEKSIYDCNDTVIGYRDKVHTAQMAELSKAAKVCIQYDILATARIFAHNRDSVVVVCHWLFFVTEAHFGPPPAPPPRSKSGRRGQKWRPWRRATAPLSSHCEASCSAGLHSRSDVISNMEIAAIYKKISSYNSYPRAGLIHCDRPRISIH